MRARKNAAALAFAPSVSFAFSFSSSPFPFPSRLAVSSPRSLLSLSLSLSFSLSLSRFSFRRLFLLFSPARAFSSVSRESGERDDETRKRERRFTGERVSVKNERRWEFSSVLLSFERSVFGRFEKHRRTRRLEMEMERERKGTAERRGKRKEEKERDSIRASYETKMETDGRTRRLFRWIRSKVKANARAFVPARLRNSTRLEQSVEFLAYRGVTRTAVPSFSNVRRPVSPRVVIRPDHLRCK